MPGPAQISPARRLPVSVLTGFLGSGKTTVLNSLLRHPGMAGTAVIINEFGAIGLDHELVETSTEDPVLLQNGCICCTIRTDLIETLRTLFFRRASGAIRPFDRLIIETTGLADPIPILHTLMTGGLIAGSFRLDGVIATVDAATAQATLDRHAEAVRQIAVADRLLLTKTDLVDDASVERLQARLRALNPAAPALKILRGAIEPAQILDTGLYNSGTKGLDVQGWLNAEAYARPGHEGRHTQDHHRHHGRRSPRDASTRGGHTHSHDVNRHDDHIRAFCVTLNDPIDGDVLGRWLETLLLLKGPDILRIKGIINVAGLRGPCVIHGVQHIFHPPVVLKRWPSKDRRTRIVFITCDLNESSLRDALKLLAREPAPKEPLLQPASVDDGDVALFELRQPD